MYPVHFQWWDFTSWIFPSTRYAGWTKSGPGVPTTRVDIYAQQHDQRLHDIGSPFWLFWNREVREAHRDFLRDWQKDYRERHKDVSYNSDGYGYLFH